MGKIYIAVVDSVNSNAFRVEAPEHYLPKQQMSEKERKIEMRARFAAGEWPREEEEDVDHTDFKRVIKKIGVLNGTDFGYITIPDNLGKPFFANPETQQLFTRHNPRIINRNDFEQVINSVRKMIADRYFEILQDRKNWQGVIESRMEMWESPHEFPYNLDNGTHKITNLYDAEIHIWDLVRLYKSIDWMRNDVVVYN